MPCAHRTSRRPSIAHRIAVGLFAGLDSRIQSFTLTGNLVAPLLIEIRRRLAYVLTTLFHVLCAILSSIPQILGSLARFIGQKSASFLT
jgi:hypothetical protein